MEIIRRAMDECSSPFIGFSAGKDSVVTADLVWRVSPDVPALMLTGGETHLLYPDAADVAARVARDHPLTVVHVDHVFSASWADAHFWEQYESFVGEWETYLWARGHDAAIIGLRAEESAQRRVDLRTRGPIHRYVDGGRYRSGGLRVCPIHDWSWRDVWAYIVSRDLPYLSAYDSRGPDGRTHLRLGRSAMRMGQLQELRRENPAGYAAILARFPDIEEIAQTC
jgi:3'-phosphoadenosine 5'-phosphosulfate sulfotransferase (PAPS reductase)/FAD synthetase